ncbi:hypothetical protein EQ500_00215, partial [Lactobacillus sp. XV13L]|nr:hypothetical protein [Lactobacillus sp. XV13L]
MIFILVNTYYPVSQRYTIGIKKLNGWKNGDIFLVLVRFGIITIAFISVMLDLGTWLIFPYQPDGFMLTCILTQVLIVLLANVSGAIRSTITNYQLQQNWAKEGKLLTLNSVGTLFSSNERQANKTMTNWFGKMAQNKGVYYVNSDFYTAKAVLPEKAIRKNPNQKYALMAVNRNFINAKLPQMKKYINSAQEAFLVPAKYKKNAKKIKYFLQNFRYNDLT